MIFARGWWSCQQLHFFLTHCSSQKPSRPPSTHIQKYMFNIFPLFTLISWSVTETQKKGNWLWRSTSLKEVTYFVRYLTAGSSSGFMQKHPGHRNGTFGTLITHMSNPHNCNIMLIIHEALLYWIFTKWTHLWNWKLSRWWWLEDDILGLWMVLRFTLPHLSHS